MKLLKNTIQYNSIYNTFLHFSTQRAESNLNMLNVRESRNSERKSQGTSVQVKNNKKRDRRHASIQEPETHERIGNVSEISRELTKVNLETYLGKCIFKDFEGTTYKGTITKLLKNKDDEMPFLQLDM